MIVNGSNLNILTQNVQVVFQKAYEAAPADYLDKLATTITSSTKEEIFPMVAEIPQLREWVGDRQANDVATYDYKVTNKDFELTVKLDRNKVQDDQYGVWMQTVVPMIAAQAKRKPALLVRDILMGSLVLTPPQWSVVGVFGLAFFVYALGGTIDQLLFPESLPNPTFGTGGILWSALTLALLTLPVVIVATGSEGIGGIRRTRIVLIA